MVMICKFLMIQMFFRSHKTIPKFLFLRYIQRLLPIFIELRKRIAQYIFSCLTSRLLCFSSSITKLIAFLHFFFILSICELSMFL